MPTYARYYLLSNKIAKPMLDANVPTINGIIKNNWLFIKATTQKQRIIYDMILKIPNEILAPIKNFSFFEI